MSSCLFSVWMILYRMSHRYWANSHNSDFFNCYGCRLFIWAEFHWDLSPHIFGHINLFLGSVSFLQDRFEIKSGLYWCRYGGWKHSFRNNNNPMLESNMHWFFPLYQKFGSASTTRCPSTAIAINLFYPDQLAHVSEYYLNSQCDFLIINCQFELIFSNLYSDSV